MNPEFIRCGRCKTEYRHTINLLTGEPMWLLPKRKRGAECKHDAADAEVLFDGVWYETGVEVQLTGPGRIMAERRRQIAKGLDAANDDEWTGGELIMAASAYAWAGQLAGAMDASDMTPEKWASLEPDYWPHAWDGWNPSNDPIRNLVIAGALVAAEIDRLARLDAAAETEGADHG